MSGSAARPGDEPVRKVVRLVLASSSPRRRELLALLGIPCRVIPSGLDERQLPDEGAAGFALRAARDKALAVAGSGTELPVLGSDTVVEVDGMALGKPVDEHDAVAMLRRLAGRVHHVHTGVALATGERCESLVDTAAVRFLPLDDALIRWYVATGEPMDKAGAYAVQGRGGLLIESIEGSPSTVIGLPVHRLPELFARCGLDFWRLTGSG
jgi:septum formation protein